jgi:hypothetical protein
MSRPAGGNATAMLRPENEAAFYHVRHYGHAAGILQHILRYGVFRNVHQLFQVVSRSPQPLNYLRLLSIDSFTGDSLGFVVCRTAHHQSRQGRQYKGK